MNCDRPVLRYYGQKWRIAPQIVALMPRHEIYVHEMLGECSHRDLLRFLRGLKGKVMVSGYPNELYDKVLKGWHRVRLSGSRDQTNEAREELVWLNFEPEGRLL